MSDLRKDLRAWRLRWAHWLQWGLEGVDWPKPEFPGARRVPQKPGSPFCRDSENDNNYTEAMRLAARRAMSAEECEAADEVHLAERLEARRRIWGGLTVSGDGIFGGFGQPVGQPAASKEE